MYIAVKWVPAPPGASTASKGALATNWAIGEGALSINAGGMVYGKRFGKIGKFLALSVHKVRLINMW